MFAWWNDLREPLAKSAEKVDRVLSDGPLDLSQQGGNFLHAQFWSASQVSVRPMVCIVDWQMP